MISTSCIVYGVKLPSGDFVKKIRRSNGEDEILYGSFVEAKQWKTQKSANEWVEKMVFDKKVPPTIQITPIELRIEDFYKYSDVNSSIKLPHFKYVMANPDKSLYFSDKSELCTELQDAKFYASINNLKRTVDKISQAITLQITPTGKAKLVKVQKPDNFFIASVRAVVW